MRNRIVWAVGVAVALQAAAATAQDLAFVACPIVRDTRTVPCWLTEYQGETYYLGIQTDVSAEFNPPSLGHRILVEGKVSDEPRICGGLVLKPVTVSVFAERADDCNTMLPSDDRLQLPFEPPRPPGPSKGRLAYDNAPPPMPAPTPPFRARNFDVPYEFDGRVGFKHPRFIQAIVDYANLVHAARIEIVGYRAATRLSDGQLLSEAAGIGERRARQIEELIRSTGLTGVQYATRWEDAAVTGGPDRRRVTVNVIPR